MDQNINAMLAVAKAENEDTKIITPFVYQQAFFPIQIIETYPSSLGSADLSLIGKGENSKHYAIKTIHDNNGFVPASEFFCYELARLVKIPTPEYNQLQLQSTEIAFGSVWEGGVHSIKDLIQVTDILTGKVAIEDLDSFFSKVFAFDLFVNNDDRHFGNYIFRDSFNNTKIGLAFDFSRAWKVNDPFGYQSQSPVCNTMRCHQLINHYNRYNKDIAEALLREIQQIPVNDIESILNNMHDSWLSQEDKRTIIEWWGSSDFNTRITNLIGVL